MAYEALYRRYRPSRFKDAFFGQDHVVAALRNAVEGDRVGHAYLFSGPRGTGKTTSARILAKALNCTNLQGGEPCNECDSCLEFQSSGGSYNLHELDAASNNGVDAMRDLIGKVALGSPGRTKVYILDEVHMLSSGAENALLKTLEEPPPHVVFVLCTTEPNKVVPTIRSRTQHLEFSLLNATQVAELIDYVVADAGLDITPADRDYVIRAGGGSARDTLSALDQVVAAGGAPQGGEHLEALFVALIDRDAPAALAAIDGALQAGRDAAGIGTALLHELRSVFLATMRADLGHLPEAEGAKAAARAADMPPARVTRAIEVLGAALIEMRQAPDPRVDLEVAVMRLTRTDLDTDPAAVLERLEAIEARLASGAVAAPGAPPSGSPARAGSGEAPDTRQVPPAPRSVDTGQPDPASAPAPAPAPAPSAQAAETPPAPGSASAPSPGPSPHDAGGAAPPSRPSAPSAGRRGADLARAELARQGIVVESSKATPGSNAGGDVPATPTPDGRQSGADQDAGAAEHASAPGSGKTLADVRRERQEAARRAGEAPADAGVEAATEARRERQAAMQAEQQSPGPPSAPTRAEQAGAPAAPNGPEAAVAGGGAASAGGTSEPGAADPPVHQQPVPAGGPSSESPVTDHRPVPQPEPQAQPEPRAQPEPQAQPEPRAQPEPEQPSAGTLPSEGELTAAWQPLLESMSGRVRSRFSAGHFLEPADGTARFGLPNPVHRDRCEEVRAEVDQALASHFGRPIPLTLVVDLVEEEPDFFATPPSGGAGTFDEPDLDHDETESIDVHDLVDATDDVPSAADRVLATFENSVLLDDPPNTAPDQ